MLPPSPMACPEIMYGRYCSFGVWLSKYLLTKGAQLTASAVLSSVHQTALKLKGRPPMVTPEMIEYDPSLLVAMVLNSSTLATSQRPFWPSPRNLQASASQVRCTRYTLMVTDWLETFLYSTEILPETGLYFIAAPRGVAVV